MGYDREIPHRDSLYGNVLIACSAFGANRAPPRFVTYACSTGYGRGHRIMSKARIVLTGLGSTLAGLSWETDRLLRIGRQNSLEVVLRDFSIDRLHAEVKFSAGRWVLRDLARNPLYPTLLNREQVQNIDRPLAVQDVIQLGKLMLRVAEMDSADNKLITSGAPAGPATAPHVDQQIRASGLHLRIQAATSRSWDEALDGVTRDRLPPTTPLPGAMRPAAVAHQLAQGMQTLVRTNHHLARIGDLNELLQSILADVVTTLGAQRAAIILADPVTGELTLRGLFGPGLSPLRTGRPYSRTLIDRCFRLGESLLCRDARIDEDLGEARSIKVGTMSSIICALLRSPRQRIGVLHLDRGPMQDAFTESDLYLTDAIAASVAVGIESAQLIEQQRQQFIESTRGASPITRCSWPSSSACPLSNATSSRSARRCTTSARSASMTPSSASRAS
jgi:hypothetical protein